MELKVPKVYKPIYTDPKRFIGLKGGRGSGKSWAVADKILFDMVQNQNLNTVCLREIQKSIAKSSKKLLEDRIEHHNLYGYFDITQNEIRCKQGRGVIIFQGLQDHTADSIKSLEGFDLCFVEEAQTISEFSLDLLIPTIRKDNSVFYFTWNPRYPNDPIEVFFTNKKNSLIIHTTYLDNPYCPQVLIDEADEMKEENFGKYEHVFLGKFINDDDMAIIQRKWLNACVDAHIKLGIEPAGKKRIGYDVADSGDDDNATVSSYGVLVYNAITWHGGKDELFTSSKRVSNQAIAEGVGEVVYDNVGVGAGVGSNFKQIGVPFQHIGFSAGSKPLHYESEYKDGKKNKDAFKNLKAQAWQMIADRIVGTYNRIEKGLTYPDDMIISISGAIPNLDELLTELSTPRIDEDGMGRFMVEKKADLAKRGIKSPNFADAFVMSCFQMSKPIVIGSKQNTISFI